MNVKKLAKLTPEEEVAIDLASLRTLDTTTPDVEGQEPYIGRVECPWCGMIGRAILDTDYVKPFVCGNCRRPCRS